MYLEAAYEGYWIARRRDLSVHTQLDYNRTFERFLDFIGADVDIADITPVDINRFLNHIRTRHGLSNKTLANAHIALSSFFTWAERELGTPHPIRNKVACPRYRRKPIEAYSETEIKAMLEACNHAKGWTTRSGRKASSKRATGLRDRAIIVTLVDTGLRSSELCNLKLRDYQQTHGRLMVHHGKGDKDRTVYLGSVAQKAVWRYLADQPDATLDSPLFSARTNKALNRDNLRHTIQRIADRAGVPNATVHRFRHTYAITFLRNGGNLLELQRLLGHESMETLQIYVQLAQSDLASAQRNASPADNWSL